MIYRLRSQRDTQHTLTMTQRAWYQLLDMAEEYGWNPMGTVLPETWRLSGSIYSDFLDEESLSLGSYTPQADRLVLLEDSLNLADALEEAFIAYEPDSNLKFKDLFATEWDGLVDHSRPGIGVILALVDFCREGAFWIERR
jgi:hypothetical protein